MQGQGQGPEHGQGLTSLRGATARFVATWHSAYCNARDQIITLVRVECQQMMIFYARKHIARQQCLVVP